ncbi:EKC/KEOPS complex subunit TP53RK-like [Uloborus diversus]|uniref:EKC/KEOPS complex subunit TP53RK-like n=1 Tax=Uloborus diversus TaxID=327109 RepID=UPI00240A793A|nr:EKC/KEOPS complex subunit TP53RK-like [Uloborus diversus]
MCEFIDDLSNCLDIGKDFKLVVQGSEAKVYEGEFLGKSSILKERFVKRYRHPDLDKTLTAERMRAEVRALNRCREIGIKCPAVYFADLHSRCIIFEKISNAVTVKQFLKSRLLELGPDVITTMTPLAHKIGTGIAKMHKSDIVHGDLTTSNLLVKEGHLKETAMKDDFDVYFIDFGLSKRDVLVEDKAVDLYVLERAVSSLHPNSQLFFDAIIDSYLKTLGRESAAVAEKLEEVRQRGRKRSMIG